MTHLASLPLVIISKMIILYLKHQTGCVHSVLGFPGFFSVHLQTKRRNNIIGVVSHWNRQSGEAMDALSLEVLKVRLERL